MVQPQENGRLTQPMTTVQGLELALEAVERRLKGIQGWEDRLGSAVRTAWHWRLLAMVMVLLNAGLAYHLTQHRDEIIPYVYVIDTEGRIFEKGTAEPYTVTEIKVMNFLEDWVRWMSERSLDQRVMKINWEQAVAMTKDRSEARALVNTYMDEQFEIIQRDKPRVEVKVMAKWGLAQVDTYRLEWTETSYLTTGLIGSQREYAGEFQIELDPPYKRGAAARSRYGLLITRVRWGPRVLPGGGS